MFKDYSEAKEPRNSVLKDDPKNIKGLFRRAQANFGVENFVEIVSGLKGVIFFLSAESGGAQLVGRRPTGPQTSLASARLCACVRVCAAQLPAAWG